MKSKFSNCSICPQYNQSMVIGETNCKDDLSKVRVLILAEAPATNEIKENTPLIGRAGSVFRDAFKISKLNELPYFISNVVLCANIVNGKTVNPPIEAVNCCKPNWQKLIEVTNPELILIMGSIPMMSFGIGNSGITKLRGKFYTYNDKKVLLTVHPSYVLQNGGLKSDPGINFLNDMFLAYNTLTNKVEEKIDPTLLKEPHYFKIPDKYYGKDYSLFNIQMDLQNKRIIYTFDKTNGSRVYRVEKMRKNYFYYCKGNNKDTVNVVPVTSVKLATNKKKIPENCATFETDIKLQHKRMVDYRYVKGLKGIEDPRLPLKIMYMDIEIYSEGSREFPRPEEAKKPINSISFVLGDGDIHVYLLRLPDMDKTPILNKDGIVVTIFDDEKELLSSFCKVIKTYLPHIMTGWNSSSFDYPYIFNRMKNLGMDINDLSPCKSSKYFVRDDGVIKCNILGVALIDQLLLYKKLVQNKKESYKLGFIADIELGKGKVAYEGTLDENYKTNINEFVEYSAVDTMLLKELEDKIKHINHMDEIIKICSTTWESYLSTIGFVDPLVMLYAKRKGLVCRDVLENKKIHFKGAFVKQPRSGLHNGVVDLDYTSLYPSIIVTYNIDISTYIAKVDKEIAENFIYHKDRLPDTLKIRINPGKLKSYKDKIITKQQLEDFVKRNKAIVCINGTMFFSHEKKSSFLSEVVNYAWDSRTKYKDEMKNYKYDSDEYHIADTRQNAYKILMNSIYGALGNEKFRFYNLDLAEAITYSGAEVSRFAQFHTGNFLKNNIDDVDLDFNDKYNNEEIPYVLYGDTDSLFISIGEYLAENNL